VLPQCGHGRYRAGASIGPQNTVAATARSRVGYDRCDAARPHAVQMRRQVRFGDSMT